MWHKVSRKLPNVYQTVLFYTKSGNVAEGELTYKDEGANKKEWVQYRWCARLKFDEVIYWRYLPKPFFRKIAAIFHLEKVKLQSLQLNKSFVLRSLTGTMPEKFIVIQNFQLIKFGELGAESGAAITSYNETSFRLSWGEEKEDVLVEIIKELNENCIKDLDTPLFAGISAIYILFMSVSCFVNIIFSIATMSLWHGGVKVFVVALAAPVLFALYKSFYCIRKKALKKFEETAAVIKKI